MPRTTATPQTTPVSRHRLTWAAAALTGLMASPAAWAGFAVSNVHPWLDDGNYPLFLNGPFNLEPDVPVTGSGVNSQARYFETRKTQLPTLDGKLLILNESADSGWNITTGPGQVVNAIASLDVEDFNGHFPAVARTTLFKNHVYADSERKISFSNSGPVSYGGVNYAAGSLFKNSGSFSMTSSYWYDAWTAGKQEVATLELAVDGQLRKTTNPCVAQLCGVTLPPGTDTAGPAAPTARFGAGIVVYDMDHVMPCGFGTQYWCDRPYAFPVAYIALAYVADAGDPDTLTLDTVLTASFEAQVGHRYLAVGGMSAESSNGSLVDFYNTASLRVVAPVGTLYSDGLGGADLGAHFAQQVPEPATWALWAAGLLGLALTAQRRRPR